LKNVNELLTYSIMLDSFMLAYVRIVIKLIELQKVLSQELNRCVASLPQSDGNEPYQKSCMRVSYILIAL